MFVGIDMAKFVEVAEHPVVSQQLPEKTVVVFGVSGD